MDKRHPKLRVGMKVRLRLGGREVLGQVVEDRGLLAPNKVQVVRVRVPISGADQTIDFEVPATAVKRVAA